VIQALRRFPALGLVVPAMVLFGVLTIVAHLRWDATLRRSINLLDSLTQSRHAAQAAELEVLRVLAAAPGALPELAYAEIRNALESSDDLTLDEGSLLLVEWPGSAPAGTALGQAGDAYHARLVALRDAVHQRLARPQAPAGLDLQAAMGQVQQAADQVENVLLEDLRTRREAQHRTDAVNILLVGVLALLLFYYLRRTEARRAAAVGALMDGEARLRALVSSMPGVSFLLDREGRYLEVFGQKEALLAAPREHVLGRTIRDVFSADQAQAFEAVIGEVLDRREVVSHGYSLTVGGEQHAFDARVSPLGAEDKVVWVSWEVTQRQRAEQRVQDLSRLYNFLSQANQAIVRATDRGALLQAICDVAYHAGGFPLVWVSWLEEEDSVLRPVARAGAGEPDDAQLADGRDAGEAAPWRALGADRVCRVADLATESAALAWYGAALERGWRGLASLPLRCAGAPVGVLNLLTDHLDPDNAEEGQLLDEVAIDISFALTQLERAAAQRGIDDRVRLHAAALESTRDGVIMTDLAGRIVSVNRAFTEITGFTEAEAIGQTPRLLRSGQHDADFYQELWASLRDTGTWQGEMCNRRKDGELYTQLMSVSGVADAAGRPAHYVSVFTDITRIKRTEAQLTHLAHFDPLTGLPNRFLTTFRLDHALEQAERAGHRLAVLFLDLDNFKTVNDGLGHATGDALLAAVARRLRARLRREDTLGRLGGDEFVLLLEHLEEPQQAAFVAEDLLEALSAPFSLGSGHDLYVQASIGISLYPDDGSRGEDLIRDADAAMYQAKRAGRNTFRFYTEALTAAASARLSMETRLRRALEQNEFELYYQPLVHLPDRRMMGAEVLARLCPPGLEPISPAVFIPLMEETGLIVALGEWVQREACRQGRAWLDAGYQLGCLAVNVSVSEIRRGGLGARLKTILEETGFPPGQLEIELTESGLMEQGGRAEAFLQDLKAQGVRLSLDDFGTGYSSLAYLKRFPLDKLKIDRSFINDIPDDPNDAQLSATIIAMARNFGLTVLAEGVETEAQLDFLLGEGCDACQGYLFSPPLPAAEFERRFLRPGA
jgi:diguanylate cyclase (GGDEF)-like protein/PAS domain S-box-containing protein